MHAGISSTALSQLDLNSMCTNKKRLTPSDGRVEKGVRLKLDSQVEMEEPSYQTDTVLTRWGWYCPSIGCRLRVRAGRAGLEIIVYTQTHTAGLVTCSSWVRGQAGTQVTTGLKPRAHEKNSRNRFKREVDAKSAICFSYSPLFQFPLSSLPPPSSLHLCFSLSLCTFPRSHLPSKEPRAYFVNS